MPARGSFQPSQNSSQLCRFRDDQPAVDTLPIWPENDSPNVKIVFPRSGCSAARVPPEVLDGPNDDGVAPANSGTGRLEVVSDVHVPKMAIGDKSRSHGRVQCLL